MLQSMTSYGRSSVSLGHRNLSVEIKTLNSKFVDLRLKVPASFQEKEMEIRKIFNDRILRGKIEATFTFENQEGGESYSINTSIFKQYFHQLKELSSDLNIPDHDLLPSILRLPEVVASTEDPITDAEWKSIRQALNTAIDLLIQHRKEEGQSAEMDLRKQIRTILQNLEEIEPFESARVEKVRQRMNTSLGDYLQRENVDENRFEQEVLFYLEKMDITEEKVRLRQHCEYFIQELDADKIMKGRKLNFISQEIGREVNTLGAKAYSSEIQKLVVMMKDALEKIKEQLANIV